MRISPFALFANIVAVLSVTALSGINVRSIEALLHCRKHDLVLKCRVDMCMRRAFFTNLVAQTPIDTAFELFKVLPNKCMVKAMLFGVIDR